MKKNSLSGNYQDLTHEGQGVGKESMDSRYLSKIVFQEKSCEGSEWKSYGYACGGVTGRPERVWRWKTPLRNTCRDDLLQHMTYEPVSL